MQKLIFILKNNYIFSLLSFPLFDNLRDSNKIKKILCLLKLHFLFIKRKLSSFLYNIIDDSNLKQYNNTPVCDEDEIETVYSSWIFLSSQDLLL